MSENVLVVPTDKVFEMLDGETGLVKVNYTRLENLIKNFGVFLPRDKVENELQLRQIIPYVVLRFEGEYILFKRTENQTEARLHNKITLGIGGHVNDSDGKEPINAFRQGMAREIAEEIECKIGNLKYIGVINDLSNQVSAVHLGVCFVADLVEYGGVKEKENFIEFRTKDLMGFVEEMESWSKILALKLMGR